MYTEWQYYFDIYSHINHIIFSCGELWGELASSIYLYISWSWPSIIHHLFLSIYIMLFRSMHRDLLRFIATVSFMQGVSQETWMVCSRVVEIVILSISLFHHLYTSILAGDLRVAMFIYLQPFFFNLLQRSGSRGIKWSRGGPSTLRWGIRWDFLPTITFRGVLGCPWKLVTSW